MITTRIQTSTGTISCGWCSRECHPALPLAGRVALTLKTVAGLSTAQIARAFLVSEATMGQRLLRARNKIAHTGIRLHVPEPHRITERTTGVLAVVYLVFTEGYATPETPDGADLAAEALRLAGLLSRLLPENDEIHGLQALLLLQHARRSARTDSDGNLVPMEEQDRGQWNYSMIAAGVSELDVARASGRPPGPYRLQAEIAALHATAVTAAATDWARVVAGYDALLLAHPSPVVALNRAVAVGFRDGQRPDWMRWPSSAAMRGSAATICYRHREPTCSVVLAVVKKRRPRTAKP